MDGESAVSEYPNTVLVFEDGARVDLRRPLEEDALDVLRRRGLLRPFAVFTSENPCGDGAKDAENDARLAELLASLRRQAGEVVRVDGMAPDGSHRERCVAWVTSLGAARAWAERYQQLALFWFDGERFWLWPALAEEAPEPLPG